MKITDEGYERIKKKWEKELRAMQAELTANRNIINNLSAKQRYLKEHTGRIYKMLREIKPKE